MAREIFREILRRGATGPSNLSEWTGNLATVRKALELYRLRHNGACSKFSQLAAAAGCRVTGRAVALFRLITPLTAPESGDYDDAERLAVFSTARGVR